MGRAKKSVRQIDINGNSFSWLASGLDEGIGLDVWDETHRRVLTCIFGYDQTLRPGPVPGSYLISAQRTVVGPRIVRAAILAALADGWNPNDDRPPWLILAHDKNSGFRVVRKIKSKGKGPVRKRVVKRASR